MTTTSVSKFLKAKISITAFDIREALRKDSIIVSELTAYMADDPHFFDWLSLPVQNQDIIDSMHAAATPNKRGELDNIDFTVQAAWSKQKGIGKTSCGLTLKAIGDESIMGRPFQHDEVFFHPKEKIDYVKKYAGKLTNRYLVLDEMLPQFGVSSKANMSRLKWMDTTSRIHGFNNYYISPEGQSLGLSTDYQLWVFLKDTKHETNLCAVVGRKGNILGPLVIKIPPERIWSKYQKKKYAFRKAVDEGKVSAMDVSETLKELDEKFKIRERYKKELEYYKIMAIHKQDPRNEPRPEPLKKKLETQLESMMLSINQMLTQKELSTFRDLVMLELEVENKTS